MSPNMLYVITLCLNNLLLSSYILSAWLAVSFQTPTEWSSAHLVTNNSLVNKWGSVGATMLVQYITLSSRDVCGDQKQSIWLKTLIWCERQIEMSTHLKVSEWCLRSQQRMFCVCIGKVIWLKYWVNKKTLIPNHMNICNNAWLRIQLWNITLINRISCCSLRLYKWGSLT